MSDNTEYDKIQAARANEIVYPLNWLDPAADDEETNETISRIVDGLSDVGHYALLDNNGIWRAVSTGNDN